MSTEQKPEIIATGSAYREWLRCPRARWWGYEAANGGDGRVRGWQRQKPSIAPTTGSYCHQVVQHLLSPQNAPEGRQTLAEAILGASQDYRDEAATRSLDVELAESGEWAIEEQAALVEAFGWAFARVRLPQLLAEYEPIAVEQEEFTLLAGDVGLAARTDAVLRRRADGYAFVYNLKTASNPTDGRWKAQWLVDQQLMTESLAVERRLGERIWGVVIDGFNKGPRVECYADTLKEVRDGGSREGAPHVYCQRSRLLYGYKTDPNPPVQPALYDWEGTTRKGWFKFAVWRNDFNDAGGAAGDRTAIEYWVNWLPVEAVEAAFVTLEPIMRSDRATEHKVKQMVANERKIRHYRQAMDDAAEGSGLAEEILDDVFYQNEHSCVYPQKCWAYTLCHEGAAEHPEDYGFIPREANHPIEEGD